MQRRFEHDSITACSITKEKTYAAHQGPVKCCAGAGHFVVTGGQDDLIHLYNIKTGQDLGFLVNPGRGSITCLEFFVPAGSGGAPSHLFSGSEDGSISIWQVVGNGRRFPEATRLMAQVGGDWTHLKQLVGHVGHITSLAVHPSGRLALSISRDRTIRMWNLVKGRCSYATKLDREADLVQWSTSGQTYALVCDTLVTLHAAGGSGQLLASLRHPRRVLSLLLCSENLAITGAEDGALRVWHLQHSAVDDAIRAVGHGPPGAAGAEVGAATPEQSTPACEVSQAHSSRIRGLVALAPLGANGLPAVLATCCSKGDVKLWDLTTVDAPSAKGQPLCVATTATQARLTCLCAADATAAASIPALPSRPQPSGGNVSTSQAAQPGAVKVVTNKAAAKKSGKQSSGQQMLAAPTLDFEIVPMDNAADAPLPSKRRRQDSSSGQPQADQRGQGTRPRPKQEGGSAAAAAAHHPVTGTTSAHVQQQQQQQQPPRQRKRAVEGGSSPGKRDGGKGEVQQRPSVSNTVAQLAGGRKAMAGSKARHKTGAQRKR